MSDYLSDEEQLERLKNWWESNGTMFVVSIVLVIAAVIGWRWYGEARQSANENAATLYNEYLEAEPGSEARSTAAKALADAFDGTAYDTFVKLRAAADAVRDGDMSGAEAQLRTVVAESDDALLADLARYRLAKLVQASDRSDEALSLLGAIRSEGYRSLAQELKGDIHRLRGEFGQAHTAYAAASASLDANDQRPILKIKLNDTAGLEDAPAGNESAEAASDEATPATEDVISDAEPEATEASEASDENEQTPAAEGGDA